MSSKLPALNRSSSAGHHVYLQPGKKLLSTVPRAAIKDGQFVKMVPSLFSRFMEALETIGKRVTRLFGGKIGDKPSDLKATPFKSDDLIQVSAHKAAHNEGSHPVNDQPKQDFHQFYGMEIKDFHDPENETAPEGTQPVFFNESYVSQTRLENEHYQAIGASETFIPATEASVMPEVHERTTSEIVSNANPKRIGFIERWKIQNKVSKR